MESARKLFGDGVLQDLSEKQLVDCAADLGCNGGIPYEVSTYHHHHHHQILKYAVKNGMMSEADYPYAPRVDKCKYNATKTVTNFTSAVRHGDHRMVTMQYAGKLLSEDDLEKKLLEHPMSVLMDATHPSFRLYKSGVYMYVLINIRHVDDDSEPKCSTWKLDHAGMIVIYTIICSIGCGIRHR